MHNISVYFNLYCFSFSNLNPTLPPKTMAKYQLSRAEHFEIHWLSVQLSSHDINKVEVALTANKAEVDVVISGCQVVIPDEVPDDQADVNSEPGFEL